MTVHHTRTFKSGNSTAVRLPKSLGIAADSAVLIEQVGDTLTIRPARDEAAERAALERLFVDLKAIGAPVDGVQAREPFEFPDRPGL